MAGIGFELTKLMQRDTLIDVASAFLHTAVAAVGPWLFTVITLAIITATVGEQAMPELVDFRTIIIYNFSVSLVLASPVFIIATRVLSDAIHAHNVTAVPTALFKSLALAFLLHVPVALLWYGSGFYTLSVAVRIMGVANLFLITAIWVLTVFLMGLKDYVAVSKSFLGGFAAAIVIIYFGRDTAAFLLGGFNTGLVITVALLLSNILSEYPYKSDPDFRLLPFFKEYWPLAVGAFCYNAAIWVDKWILWFSPESTVLASGMRIFPDYDHSMFIAILLTVPAFVLFVFSVETDFFHHYQRFFGDILGHKPLSRILRRKGELISSVNEGARQLVFTQGVVTCIGLVMAGSILLIAHVRPEAVGIFRFGVVGALFHLLMLTATIILSYFDCRKQCMWLYMAFLVINMVVTMATLSFGYYTYGFGYFIASILTFAAAIVVLFSHLRNLAYHAFITNNLSVKA